MTTEGKVQEVERDGVTAEPYRCAQTVVLRQYAVKEVALATCSNLIDGVTHILIVILSIMSAETPT